MKAKNAVVGTRVQVKEGVTSSFYESGQTGVIEVVCSDLDVLVRFDISNDQWYVPLSGLRRIKE